jgi:hypothetical protein
VFITAVPRNSRSSASSLSVVIFNMGGYCLSPVLTGYVMNHFNGDPADRIRAGFRVVLLWTSWSVMLLQMARRGAMRDVQRSAAARANGCRGRGGGGSS